MSDLLVRGGTVVTAEGSRRADVLVEAGRIEAVLDPETGTRAAASAGAVVDAAGLLVLPGVIDVHTHTRIATDADPDRFFQDTWRRRSAARPRSSRSTTRARAPRAGRAARCATGLRRVAGGHRRPTPPSTSRRAWRSWAGMDDPIAELPAIVEAGVPTAKAFMVYDFALDDRRLFDALRHDGQGRRPARGALRGPGPHRRRRGLCARPGSDAAARSCRVPVPARRRPWPPIGRSPSPRRPTRPIHVVHLSSAAALEEVRRAPRRGRPRLGRDVPALPGPDRRPVRRCRTPRRSGTSSRRRCGRRPTAMRCGRASPTGRSTSSRPTTCRTGSTVEKRVPAPPFPDISNGAPGVETLLAVVYGEGVARGRITVERMVDVLSTTPARRFGLGSQGRGRGGAGRRPRAVRPRGPPDDPRGRPPPHERLHAVRGARAVAGAVRSVFVRGRAVVRDGAFVGERGLGRFVERTISA